MFYSSCGEYDSVRDEYYGSLSEKETEERIDDLLADIEYVKLRRQELSKTIETSLRDAWAEFGEKPETEKVIGNAMSFINDAMDDDIFTTILVNASNHLLDEYGFDASEYIEGAAQ